MFGQRKKGDDLFGELFFYKKKCFKNVTKKQKKKKKCAILVHHVPQHAGANSLVRLKPVVGEVPAKAKSSMLVISLSCLESMLGQP